MTLGNTVFGQMDWNMAAKLTWVSGDMGEGGQETQSSTHHSAVLTALLF